MVQMRCPECGYLQTLSEERFLALAEDYLDCPHCSAKVPKIWAPQDDDYIPEETRHKMMAFSRRILSGRSVAREVVFALESLVRHHGPIDDVDKAVGAGYAMLGEPQRAEPFLFRARLRAPNDPEIMHWLLEVFLGQDKFEDAVEVGQALLGLVGEGVNDRDVAALALALAGLGRMDQAEEVLDSHPTLDPKNPLVKQARRAVRGPSGHGIMSLFSEKGPLGRILAATGTEGLRKLVRRVGVRDEFSLSALRRDQPPEEHSSAASHEVADSAASVSRVSVPAVAEYWIYTRKPDIPKWEVIRGSFLEQTGGETAQDGSLQLLETLIQQNAVTVEYIFRKDVKELFDYPEELITQNSRGFEEVDRRDLIASQMIVRVRIVLEGRVDQKSLLFCAAFVEAVRVVTGGIVQDAVSHALWGLKAWKRALSSVDAAALERDIRVEMNDEQGNVWIHTHGMGKFGLPDLEMENIARENAPDARRLMLAAAQRWIERPDSIQSRCSLEIPGHHGMLQARYAEPDEEGHFPGGSIKLERRAEEAAATAEHEHLSHAVSPADAELSDHVGQMKPESLRSAPADRSDHDTEALKERLLKAHKRARADLADFRASFLSRTEEADQVHAVKVGFSAEGDTYEWMWVSLEQWLESSITGNLENAPVLRTDLHKGVPVQLTEDQIFDWVVVKDGRVSQGAYTEDIVQCHG